MSMIGPPWPFSVKNPSAGAMPGPQADDQRKQAAHGLFGGRGGTARLLGLFRLHLLDPEAVVLARPLLFDLAVAHGVEGALHTDRAEVDMRDDDRHEHEGDDRMP